MDVDFRPGGPVSALSAARAGLLLGVACAAPVTIWLGAIGIGSTATATDPRLVLQIALRGLWIAQAISLALALPRALGRSWPGAALALALLLAAPLPLLCLASLGGAVTTFSIASALGLGVLWGMGVTCAGWAVRRVISGENVRATASGALELVLAGLAWNLRDEWIRWTGL